MPLWLVQNRKSDHQSGHRPVRSFPQPRCCPFTLPASVERVIFSASAVKGNPIGHAELMASHPPVRLESTVRWAVEIEESISVSIVADDAGRADIVMEAVQPSADRSMDALALMKTGCNVARIVLTPETVRAIAKALDEAVATYTARAVA